jgi:GDPmannose 4,6-dehydratase
LRMGNLDSHREWGFAGDYVEAMWMMLQQPSPDDYVVATGIAHSVKDLVKTAFSYAGLDWQKYVVTDRELIRPAEVEHLLGDSGKARRALKW